MTMNTVTRMLKKNKVIAAVVLVILIGVVFHMNSRKEMFLKRKPRKPEVAESMQKTLEKIRKAFAKEKVRASAVAAAEKIRKAAEDAKRKATTDEERADAAELEVAADEIETATSVNALMKATTKLDKMAKTGEKKEDVKMSKGGASSSSGPPDGATVYHGCKIGLADIGAGKGELRAFCREASRSGAPKKFGGIITLRK